ncbi:MAG TPA: type II secretion system protein [Lacipirellulaceae bacterium]|nr:type II secretion system protein [Lacipirellulaceae bacterium]
MPRPGLTLIELLVTIVILVTLLAAVLPAVSPNNESRKIREAARQLRTLFAQAQAQAARDGRRVGVGFNDTETWTDANNNDVRDPGEVTHVGMASSAYLISEPPPFTGFSTSAGVRCGPPNNNAPNIDDDQPPLVNLHFGHGVGGEGIVLDDPSDALPPEMFRGAFVQGGDDVEGSGDIVHIGQETFELVTNDCDDGSASAGDDDMGAEPDTEELRGVTYLKSQQIVTARWLSWRGRPPALLPQGGKAYRISRAPVSGESPSRTSAEAIQFPRGVGIDLDPTEGNRIVSVLFAPNGAIDALYIDGRKRNPEPFLILIGRIENGNPPDNEVSPGVYDIDYARYDFDGSEDDDQLAQRRQEVNLLNEDSRWLAISPAGRIVVSLNAMFDPRLNQVINGTPPNTGDSPQQQRERQRFLAQEYARNYQNEAG